MASSSCGKQRCTTGVRLARGLGLVLVTAALSGCTSIRDYVHNGFKVGPNYCPPVAMVAPTWIDANDIRLRQEYGDISRWWTVFQDSTLDNLIACAYNQSLTLREAGFRILEARAQLAIARGDIFPQNQFASGSYTRNAASGATAGPGVPATFFDRWDYGFSLQWELDFWGRFRRAIAANEALLDESIWNFDTVLVGLMGDVADTYVQIRTTQKRIEVARANVELQRGILNIAERRFEAGRTNELDVDQARSQLGQLEAAIPALEIQLRQFCNALSILLGVPPYDIEKQIGVAPIPIAPREVVVGIPADLLRRRPDVRAAERRAAAQAEQIGIAEAALYPAFSINGTLGWTARDFGDLFTANALSSSVGPSFNWAILNYGRLVNNVQKQEAAFNRLCYSYEIAVLNANREVENGMVRFLKSQEQAKQLDEAVIYAKKAVDIVVKQYNVGTIDFNRVAQIEQNLISQQDLQTQAYGQIAQGLVQVYRALGGGWEFRCPGILPQGVPLPVADPANAQPATEIPEMMKAPNPPESTRRAGDKAEDVPVAPRKQPIKP